ncbi:MAG: hypothetical protein U1A78_27230 [Polyangia bacterium]
MKRSLLALKALLLAALPLGGCYSPDLTNVRWSCTGSGQPDDCPSGYTCFQSMCRAPGEIPGAQEDGGLPTNTVNAPGCAAMVGYEVAKDPTNAPAFACPGRFYSIGGSSTNANSICAAGYEVCQNADRIDFGKCNAPSIPGFFIARVRGEQSNGMGVCPGNQQLQEDFWAGCGNTSAIRAVTVQMMCSGFSQGRDCDQSGGSSFNCRDDNDRNLEEVTSTNPVHGVLCCKKP